MNIHETPYSDFRSHSTPKRRENSSKSKYHLKFRHGLNNLPNTPEARADHRIQDLLLIDGKKAQKDTWQIPASQQTTHYGISRETLNKYPEGKWKREFLWEARRRNHRTRCRCSDYCMLVYANGPQCERKVEMRRSIQEGYRGWAWEESVVMVDVAMDHYWEEWEYRNDDLEIPEESWEGVVEMARVSKRLRKGRLVREVDDSMSEGEEEMDMSGSEEEMDWVGVEEGAEWEFVECLGCLSDAESWEEDFDSASSWSV